MSSLDLNIYDIGDVVVLEANFTLDSVATSPTFTILSVKRPDGAYESFLSSLAGDGGSWDAGGNTPTLADGTGSVGTFYEVSVAGNVDLGHGEISFSVGDTVVYDGNAWIKLEGLTTATLGNPETGKVNYPYPLHIKGRYFYRFAGCGNINAASEDSFIVNKSLV